MSFRWWTALAGAGLSAGLVVGPAGPGRSLATDTAVADSTAPQLHVSGNELVDQGGARVVLHGVDRSGGEYMCVNNAGIWDGPMNQTAVNAMKRWKVNAVRVPLNEACWNGDSYINQAYRGNDYRRAVKKYVNLLNRNGIVAILDLHWTEGAYTGPSSGCSSVEALCQKPMPDTAQAVRFWTSVARAFGSNDAVIFDLFNEPYPERATGATGKEGWHCWLRGGICTGISYRVAGMQTLISAVRSTGATNVIMLGGLEYANDLDGWLAHEPTDPDHNLAASWHSYNFNACSTSTLLARSGRTGHRQGAAHRRRDRRERLRPQLHRFAHALAGRPVRQLPRLGLERRLRLHHRARADQQLHRYPYPLRPGIPGTPESAGLTLRPATRSC